MAEYGKTEYWDERYTKDPEVFEWYQTYQGIRHVLQPWIHEKSNVLIVGCGNSSMGEDLAKAGVHKVTSIDTSRVVVQQMSAKHREITNLAYTVMDVRRMQYPDASFDVCVDKGLLDTLLCMRDGEEVAKAAFSEIYRILKPSGALVLVSHGGPEGRAPLFQTEKLNWQLQQPVARVPKPRKQTEAETKKELEEFHFVYVVTKALSSTSAGASSSNGSSSNPDKNESSRRETG